MKNIRSKFVKKSLLDYENLANTLKENTSSAVKDLLSEAVRDTYSKILTESDDDENEDENDYDVEEVEDTNSDDTNDAEDTESSDDSDDVEDDTDDDVEDDTEDDDLTDNSDTEESEDDADITDDDMSDDTDLDSSDEDGWAEFNKYKVSDDEYDFSEADDDEIVKVYKLLKDDDQVMVNVDNDAKKVELKDNQTGAEYLLDLSSFNGGGVSEEPMDGLDYDDEAEGELEDDNNMNESKRIYEVVLNEYDSHVGYTDSYQKNDVMSTPSNTEPGKNVNDWDAGVPKGSSKPWVGKGNNKPFDKNVSEEDEMFDEEETMEEATNVGGFVQQNSTSKSHIPNSNGRKARNSSVAGVKTKGTANPRYSSAEATNEGRMMKKVNKILKENEQLKSALSKFKNVLKEAAVTNVNLGQIIKIISENSTTKDEKQEIIARFGKEAKTVEQSKNLYESISSELKKNNKMNINEDKQFTTNGSKMINEQQIYKSKDLNESLDLMHRICK